MANERRGRLVGVMGARMDDRGRRELPFSADFAGATLTLDPSQELVLKNDNNVLRSDIQQKSSWHSNKIPS